MLLAAKLMIFSGAVDYIARFGLLDPVTAAWMPLLAFGPVAFSLLHRIGT
jgi:hypothetical protein